MVKQLMSIVVVTLTAVSYGMYNHYTDKIETMQKEMVNLKKINQDQNNILRTLKKADSFEAELTAYTNGYESTGKNPTDAGYGITSSGKIAKEGTIAADTNFLPYGTKLYIDGLGVYEVQDTGGDINGNRLDIWFKDLNKALEFGRQYRRVYILKS